MKSKDEQIKKDLNQEIHLSTGDWEDISNPVNANKSGNPADAFVIEDVPQEILAQNKNKSKSVYDVRNVVADMMMDSTYRRSHGANMDIARVDTKKIGSKVRFKPTDQERIQNEKIDAAKAISKNATAYTLEIYNTLTAVDAQMADSKIDADDVDGADEFALNHLQIFSQISFTDKMFSGAYIRKNLETCFRMIRSYQNLKEHEANIPQAYRVQIRDLDDYMPLFTKRVSEYCRNNHVKFDTNGVSGCDERLPEEEKTTDEDHAKWFLLTESAKAKRQEERQNALFEKQKLSNRGLTGEDPEEYKNELEEILTKVSEYDENEFDESVEDILESDTDRQMELLPSIKGFIAHLKKELEDRAITDPNAIRIARTRVAEYSALVKFIEAEIRFDEAQLADDTITQRSEEFRALFRASEDLRRIIRRSKKPLDILSETTQHSGITTLTRSEALSTESDKQSFRARANLLAKAQALLSLEYQSPAESAYCHEVYDLALKYFNDTFYKVGAKAESDAIRELKRKLSELRDDLEISAQTVAELKEIVTSLTNGSLPQVDPGNLPENATYRDCSRIRPTTTGQRHVTFFTRVREDALRLFRKWTNPGADAPLFAHEPTVNDLRQGKVSNCWMVAGTTSVISMNPQAIKDAMVDNGDGTVTVRLFTSVDSTPQANYIKVSKEVPSLRVGGAIHTSGALWMQLLEKAAAFMGYQKPFRQNPDMGYDALWYGTAGDWIYALTGKKTESIISSNVATGEPALDAPVRNGELEGITKIPLLDDEASNYVANEQFQTELYNQMLVAREKGYIYNYSSRISNAPGMNEGHAYSVLSVGEEENGERYVILRNPYGNMNAAYQDNGELTRTEYYMSSAMNETCGQFKIKFTDFIKNAGSLSRTKLQ